MKLSFLFFIWFFAFDLMTFPAAFAQDMSPADFGDKRSEFIEKLDLPVIADGAVLLIRCATHITAEGEFRDTVCYQGEEDVKVSRTVAKQVRKAVRWLEIDPAIVGDAASPVWFNFSVAYRQTGDSQQIQVFDSHLYNREKLGMDYSGAQRYNLSSWRCPGGRGLPVMVNVELSATGEIEDIQASAEGRCAQSIIRTIRNSKFIPARLHGEDVESVYRELFFR